MDKSCNLGNFFRTEVEARKICAYNKHANIEPSQEGGTAMIALDEAAASVTKIGTDPSGLGRWTWMKIKGKGTHVTRVICAYQLCCTSENGGETTTAAQHRQYFRERGDERNPRELFRHNLIKQLKEWRRAGDKIILMLDANEDMDVGPLSRMLRHRSLGMKEIVKTRTGQRSPATYFRGSKPIDGAWCTPYVECVAARMIPFSFRVGDHRMIIVDVTQQSFYGEERSQVVRASARRLQCKIDRSIQTYGKILIQPFQCENLFQRLDNVYTKASYPPTVEVTNKLIGIDKMATQLMILAENKCRHLYMGDIPFTDEYALWDKRRMAYKDLIKVKEG